MDKENKNEQPVVPIDNLTPNTTTTTTNEIITVVKNFSPATLIASGLATLFLLFCFVDDITVRWWIMIPIAIAGFVLSYKQKQNSQGTELLVCKVTFWAFIIMFLIRDAIMAHQIATLIDGFSEMRRGLEGMFE